MNGKLYIVATPIGNLEDITLRAIRVLKEVDLILCEDTRVTKKLLAHYDISKRLLAYNAYASDKTHEEILRLLEEGKSIALVSDAGTPTVSDPGSRIVARARARFGNEVSVVAVPGPSALVAALSVSGVPASEFIFLGFLPHKKGRKTALEFIASKSMPVIFYESTHRILKLLEELGPHVDNTKMVVLAREMTKIHEEVLTGTPPELYEYLTQIPEKQKGEFVVIVAPK